MTLADLREVERGLKILSDKVFQKDTRLFELWSEYFSALRIKERHPNWKVEVKGARASPDVVCIEDDKKIRIQVKTGKWQKYHFGSDVMHSADASFGIGTQIKKKKFDFLVFLIHEEHIRIKEILIFSIDELQEIDARPTMAGFPKTNPCLLTKVESIEKFEKWIEFHHMTAPIYEIERDMIENPVKYVDRWNKIKFVD